MAENNTANDPYGVHRGVMPANNPESLHSVTVGEAARRVRESGLFEDVNPMTAEDRHRANFAGRVCTALGLESTVENFARMEMAMEKLGIKPHEGHEYPKWVPSGRKEQVFDHASNEWVDGKKDEMIIVHDEDDEARVGRGEAPKVRVENRQNATAVRTDQPIFGIRSTPIPPVDDREPSSLGADGAKAQSGTFDEGRGPPMPPGYPNTGGRFLTEDSPDRGVPGYPNAGTGRNESAGPAQLDVDVEGEGVARPGAPTHIGERSNEPGYSGGSNDINAPHAGPEGYLDTGSKPTDTAAATARERDSRIQSDRERTEVAESEAKEELRRRQSESFLEAGAGRLKPVAEPVKPSPKAPQRRVT